MGQDGEAPFSRRFGFEDPNPEIAVREDAPPWLRQWALRGAEELGVEPSTLREITRRVLPAMPEYGRFKPTEEALLILKQCKWYSVYDFLEALYQEAGIPGSEVEFEEYLNKLFHERGVGWQMRAGKIEFRGSEPFEVATGEASATLAAHGHQTAASEIHEALQDLSRRPKPDLSGAVQHAMAALECVAREVSGDNATLGDIIRRHAAALGLGPPLALTKLWGYASEQGRHLREGREPGPQETELVVSVAAAVAVYMSKRAAVDKIPPTPAAGPEGLVLVQGRQ